MAMNQASLLAVPFRAFRTRSPRRRPPWRPWSRRRSRNRPEKGPRNRSVVDVFLFFSRFRGPLFWARVALFFSKPRIYVDGFFVFWFLLSGLFFSTSFLIFRVFEVSPASLRPDLCSVWVLEVWVFEGFLKTRILGQNGGGKLHLEVNRNQQAPGDCFPWK